jgi:hypothetical protein
MFLNDRAIRELDRPIRVDDAYTDYLGAKRGFFDGSIATMPRIRRDERLKEDALRVSIHRLAEQTGKLVARRCA